MVSTRTNAIAALLNQHMFVVINTAPNSAYSGLDGLHTRSAHVHKLGRAGIMMRFSDRARPLFIYANWLSIQPDGSIQAKGQNSKTLFRLVPGPFADLDTIRAEAQAVNNMFGRPA